jgi:hypothetical protein
MVLAEYYFEEEIRFCSSYLLLFYRIMSVE